jgi:predicted RNA-binding Zn ribbon-like protein
MNSHLPPALFVGESLGLDFLNSIATPVDIKVEWIGNGSDLLDWLEQARLVPVDVLNEFRISAVPGELDGIASQARSLREWFRDFVNQNKGRKLNANSVNALEPINRLLARDEAYNQVVFENGSNPSYRKSRRWRSPESLLMPIAEAMANLICEEDMTYVKACEGHDCTLMFLDRTKSHARRWCSMGICGNRAKQAAHRARAKKS